MIGCSRETVTRGIKILRNTGYISPVGRGLAIEQRAIRRYLEPSLQNLSVFAEEAEASGRHR